MADMEKYGVCKTCYDIPNDVANNSEFVKLANGDVKCGTCGQMVLKGVVLEENVNLDDNKKDV